MDSKKIFIFLIFTLFINIMTAQKVVYFANGSGVSSLKDDKISRIFSGKENYWGNNKQIVVCLPSTKSEDVLDICQKVYNQSVRDVQKFWLSIVFQGRAKSPKFFDTEQEMIDFVKKNPGAIGVLPTDKKSMIPSGLIITTI